MKQLVHIPKLIWKHISFWILFFVMVVLLTLVGKLSIYITSSFGALLIAYRVHSIKGSIKRLPYFLSLLALSFIFVFFAGIFGFSFVISYFFAATLFVTYISSKFFNLTQEILGLTVPAGFIRSVIISFFCLCIFYPFVVMNIKRLRDINLSGWFSLITLIPGISLLFEIFLCFKGTTKRSRKNRV